MSLPDSPLDAAVGAALLDHVSLGVSVYRYDDPSDPRSLRLVYGNATSAALTGLDVEPELGRLLVDIAPGVDETDLLDRYHHVATSLTAEDLGLVTYGDDRLEEKTYAVNVYPLPGDSLGVVFEDVSLRSELLTMQETQAELSREEARYRSLVEATAAVVWTTPPSGEFIDIPDSWLRVTGQTAEEATGWGWLDAIHPDDREATAAAWNRAVDGGDPYVVEHRLRQADGSYRRMAVRGAPVRDLDGAVREWVGIHTDIEEQTRAAAALADSEARLRTLFDAISDVVLLYPVGPDGIEPIILANEAAVETYGYARHELLAMTVDEIVDTDRLDLSGALAELRRTRKGQFDSVHRTRDGRRIPMSTNARLIEYDGRLCVLAVCRDDSERRAFRRELSRLNHQLERDVAERTQQVEGFAEDLKILHRISTDRFDDASDRLEAYLEAGCQMFDLPVGILSSTPLDEASGQRLYRLEAVVSPDPSVTAGLTIPLEQAFCHAVVSEDATVAYADACEDPVGSQNPACDIRGFRAFLGTPVRVNGELFGTLNFVSPEPRAGGFATYERDLIEVMADTIGRQLGLAAIRETHNRTLERYETIVETLQEGLVLADRDGQIVQANAAAQAALGVGDGTALSTRWPVVDEAGNPVPPEALPEREALRTGSPVRDQLQGIVRPDGETRWYVVNATPVDHDADGVSDSVVVSFADVTGRRAASAAAARLQALLGSVLAASPDGVMAFQSVRDDGGAIVDFTWVLANPRALEIVQREAGDLVGNRLLDVFPGNREAGLFDAYAAVVETGEIYQAVVPYPRDGFETAFRIVASPIEGEDGLTVSFVDVPAPDPAA